MCLKWMVKASRRLFCWHVFVFETIPNRTPERKWRHRLFSWWLLPSFIYIYIYIYQLVYEVGPVYHLGGGFKYFFHPYLGKWSNLTNIFSDRLKPPSRSGWSMNSKLLCPTLLRLVEVSGCSLHLHHTWVLVDHVKCPICFYRHGNDSILFSNQLPCVK